MGYLIDLVTSESSGFEYRQSIFSKALKSGQWDSNVYSLIEAARAGNIHFVRTKEMGVKFSFFTVQGCLKKGMAYGGWFSTLPLI